ncbi:MAG: type II toxin-antitoxin system RelE/ParE family toxin [Pseudomonadota bacterium]
MKLRWSKRAVQDVARLRDYIALDSPFYARQFIGRLVTRLEGLPELPQSGRLVPEAERDDIREIIYQGYRAIYQLRETQHEIVIVAVVHGSRDLTNTQNQTWNKPIN